MGNCFSVLSSYADDIKLFGSSLSDIRTIFDTTQSFLQSIGLECLARDCKLMIINGPVGTDYSIGGFDLVSVSDLRFLGICIDHEGHFRPQKTDYSKALWSLFHRVKALGLSCYP